MKSIFSIAKSIWYLNQKWSLERICLEMHVLNFVIHSLSSKT